MQRVRLAFGLWSVLALLFLYFPIVVLVVYSFNHGQFSKWDGFSTRWYDAFWARCVSDFRDWAGADSMLGRAAGWAGADGAAEVLKSIPPRIRGQVPGLVDGLKNSLLVGLSATAVSVTLGTLGAWLIFKYKYPLHNALSTLVAVPMIVPEILMGVSLLMGISFAAPLLAAVGISFGPGFWAIVIAHVTFSFPYVMVTIQARLTGLDPALEEAAMDLGATPAQAFRLVILPYLWPAILSGTLMALTLSLDDFIVTYFVQDGASQTLPIKIYGAYKGQPPMVHVVSTVMIGATVLLVVVAEGLKRFRRT